MAYSIVGALGGVVVDAILPGLMRAYATATAPQQEILRIVARTAYQAVAHGVWNPLEVLLVSIWFLGVGVLLRPRKRGLGALAVLVSLFGFQDPVGWIVGSEAILNIGAMGTVFIPVWSIWFGTNLLRGPDLIPGYGGPLPATRRPHCFVRWRARRARISGSRR